MCVHAYRCEGVDIGAQVLLEPCRPLRDGLFLAQVGQDAVHLVDVDDSRRHVGLTGDSKHHVEELCGATLAWELALGVGRRQVEEHRACLVGHSLCESSFATAWWAIPAGGVLVVRLCVGGQVATSCEFLQQDAEWELCAILSGKLVDAWPDCGFTKGQDGVLCQALADLGHGWVL